MASCGTETSGNGRNERQEIGLWHKEGSRTTEGEPGNGRVPHGSGRAVALSIVVPTKNEAGNIAALVERIERALPEMFAEVLFVDDSDDGTPEEIRRVALESRLRIELLHRPPDERADGLGGAVVLGLRNAKAPLVAVMDGDLQHPPELLPRLMETAQECGADIVVASRFRDGGGTDEFGALRSVLSWGSKAAARLVFPVRLRRVTDPMSGFFLVRRAALELESLRPRGFKILLEILVRTPGLRRAEVGFRFGTRLAGDSKASLDEGLRYLAQLGAARLDGSAGRFTRYSLVGATGLGVNMAVFALLVSVLGIHYLVAAVLATQLSTAWNFVGTDRWVYPSNPGKRSARMRAARFFLMNNATLLLRGPILVLLVTLVSLNALAANAISLIALGMMRFAVSDVWIWGAARVPRLYAYSIHGIASVESPVRLRELEKFRVERLGEPASIRVHIGKLSRSQSELVRALSFTPHTRYDEGLGRFGFGVDISMGTTTQVVASPLLARSPHVLYTNVVEPILRWLFVSRGYALVHGACIAQGESATMVTAQTDTGKTTTILKLLDRGGMRFLSDDLTLVDEDGRVLAYPKPLTISSHTVQAVRTPLIPLLRRGALVFQSRVHSRSGRRFAFLLTHSGLPVATINAIVQFIIPPPKYHVEQLVPGVEHAADARLSRFFVIERADGGDEHLTLDEAVETLLENSDDAFGFPPYPSIREFLYRPNGTDLREVERSIVASALEGVPAMVLRSETMSWAERVAGTTEQPSGLEFLAPPALVHPSPTQ